MATKTISLELDAYEKLRRAKKGGESFSAVVRRARFAEPDEGELLVNEKPAAYGATASSVETTGEYWDRIGSGDRIRVALESFEAAVRRQEERNRKWKAASPGKLKGKSGRGWTREDLYADRTGES
jgi:hypothetical protein